MLSQLNHSASELEALGLQQLENPIPYNNLQWNLIHIKNHTSF